MQPKVSVIIPVYNTENYLHHCIDSVVNIEFFKGLELIFINDGSTDSSLDILQEYNARYDNITIIDKENAGLAAARNSGVKIAKGDYILFLDSDDFLLNHNDESAIKRLVKIADQASADVLCFNYTRKKDFSPQRKAPKGITSNTSYLVHNNIYTSSACTKLIKRSVLIDNNIYFEEGTLSEDILFCAKLLDVKNVKVVFLNEVLYFYRQREGSITNTINTKHIFDILNIINTLKNSMSTIVLSYTAFQYATLLININLSDQKPDNKILKEMSELSYLLKYNRSLLIKCIKCVNRVLGIRLTSNLMSFAFKIQRWLSR